MPAFAPGGLGQAYHRRRLPIRLSSLGDNRGVDSAAHIEAGGEPEEACLHRALQMVRNLVGHRLVKRAAIAE